MISSWSDTTLKYGNPAQRKAAEMKKGRAVTELMGLEQEEGQREDVARSRGPFSSGYDGEKDYIAGLNRQGQIADLRSRLSGQGPGKVNHSYAGTSFAERDNSMPSQRPASLRALDEPGDNSDYFMRQAKLRGANASADREENAAMEEWQAGNPMLQRARGDVRRDEFGRDAAAQGDAARSEFFANDGVRRQKLWDDEERQVSLGPYSPQAIKAQTETDKQRAISERESMKALYGYRGRVDAQAERSYGAVGAAEANQGRDVGGYRDELGSRLPGAGDKVASRDEITEIARSRGVDPAQVEQFFVSRGYAIR